MAFYKISKKRPISSSLKLSLLSGIIALITAMVLSSGIGDVGNSGLFFVGALVLVAFFFIFIVYPVGIFIVTFIINIIAIRFVKSLYVLIIFSVLFPIMVGLIPLSINKYQDYQMDKYENIKINAINQNNVDLCDDIKDETIQSSCELVIIDRHIKDNQITKEFCSRLNFGKGYSTSHFACFVVAYGEKPDLGVCNYLRELDYSPIPLDCYSI